MANFTPLCGNACLQVPTGERGKTTKREDLFMGTDCDGEQARLRVAERARTPFRTLRTFTRQTGSIPSGFLSGFCSDSQQESAGF